MNWDKKNKERLIKLLSDKFDYISRENNHANWRRLFELRTERKDNSCLWSDAMDEEFNSSPIVREWRAFTSQYGIIEVARSRKNSPWRTGGCPWAIHERPKATNPKRIIVDDPLDIKAAGYYLGPRSFGLSIPKEVAEKFLVLGIP